MEILLSLVYATIFIFIIRRAGFFKLNGLNPQAIPLLFVIKLIAGVSLGLIYTYYYTDRLTSDTFRLFDDSAVVYGTLSSSPADFFRIMTGIGGDAPHLDGIYNSMHNWYDVYSPVNDNRFMIRLNTLLRFFSFGYYYIHVVFVAFLATTGTVALIRFASNYLTDCTRILFLLVGFLPSVLFWGSGLMKDAVVIFSLGFTLYFFGKTISSDGKIRDWAMLLLCLVLLTFSRFQVLVITLPGLFAWYLVFRTGKSPALVFTSVMLFFLLLTSLLPTIDPDINLPGLLYRKQQSFIALATTTQAGSMIDPIHFEPDFVSVLLYAPIGFCVAFIRPFLTDASNPLIVISAVENLLILLFGIYCIMNSRGNKNVNEPLFLFCALFVFISFSLIGLVTPVLGAMVRYKTPALPLLMILFLLLINPIKRQKLNHLSGKLPI